ncbi:MAG: DNA replication/repair protein RecF [Candidatus Nanopelagicales bacterium]|nr:DNA replication/repair protein RecF [Candidatus Nanopelagicales bacterium]
MWVQALRLTDFRSYPTAEVLLQQGVTTFVGRNGQGKTNLVEALGYAATFSSHRVATDAPLVRAGAERAVISVEAVLPDRACLVEIEINPGRANRARLNRSPASRPRDVLGIVQTVLFAPEDLALVKGDPSERRRFLDDLLVQRSPRMLGVKADYDRILKQRNALLKSAAAARRTPPPEMLSTLDVWDEQAATVGGELVAARIALLHELSPHVTRAYEQISGSPSGAAVAYASGTNLEATSPDRDAWRTWLLDAMHERRREELSRGITLVGPQRDDVSMHVNGHPAKGFASHGESWSFSLAMRLASLAVLRSDGGEPILILDDVFAELDTARRNHLVQEVLHSPQVLITAAVPEDVPPALGGHQISVTQGQVGCG